jgi:hypothetical protein
MSSHRLLARFLAPASVLHRLARTNPLLFRSVRPILDFSRRSLASARSVPTAASASEQSVATSSTDAQTAVNPSASDSQVDPTASSANQNIPQIENVSSAPADAATATAGAGAESPSASSASVSADDASTAAPIGHSLDTVDGLKSDSGSGGGSGSAAQASSSYFKVLTEIRELRNRSWRFLGTLFALLGTAGALVYLNWDRMLHAFGRHGATVAQVSCRLRATLSTVSGQSTTFDVCPQIIRFHQN